MEANKEIRNDELKMSIITLKLQDDKESEEVFINELKNSYFLIPAVNDNKKDELTFMLLCDQKNNNYFQAYTDKDEYNKWDEAINSKNFVLTFDELANIVISSGEEIKGLVINPFTENVILNKEYLEKIFKINKIFIDKLKKCPTKVKNVITKVLKQQEQVKEAYLLYIEKNNIPGYLLIIDSDIKDQNKLYDKIGKNVTDNIDQINIDIISTNDEIAKEVIKDKKVFYTKK